jgi:hypothetical protein
MPPGIGGAFGSLATLGDHAAIFFRLRVKLRQQRGPLAASPTIIPIWGRYQYRVEGAGSLDPPGRRECEVSNATSY